MSRRASFALVAANVLSLVALFLALGGPGYAASIARTVFATNSDKVDGFHASSKPKAGTLIPLDRKAKLPASVLPLTQGPRGLKGDTGATGTQGPQGIQGAQGLQGPIGPSDAYVGDGSTLAQTPVAPAGSYVVFGEGRFDNTGPVTTQHCVIVPSTADMYLNDSSTIPANGSLAVPLMGYMRLSTPGRIAVGCTHPDGAQYTVDVWVTAIRVGTLTTP